MMGNFAAFGGPWDVDPHGQASGDGGHEKLRTCSSNIVEVEITFSTMFTPKPISGLRRLMNHHIITQTQCYRVPQTMTPVMSTMVTKAVLVEELDEADQLQNIGMFAGLSFAPLCIVHSDTSYTSSG